MIDVDEDDILAQCLVLQSPMPLIYAISSQTNRREPALIDPLCLGPERTSFRYTGTWENHISIVSFGCRIQHSVVCCTLLSEADIKEHLGYLY